MTPRRKKRRLWSYSAGDYGCTVTVCEREKGGMLYQRITHPTKGQVYRSLGHRDHELAERFARETSDKLRAGLVSADSGSLTIERLFALYLADMYPEHGEAKKGAEGAKAEDERRIVFFTVLLGASRLATSITITDWDRIRARRASGEIDSRGNVVRKKDRKPVSATTVAHDGVFLRAVYFWAMRTRGASNVPLMSYNPFAAPGPGAKSAFVVAKNAKPRRPRVSDDRYDRVRAVAHLVLMDANAKTPGAVQVPTAPRTYRASETKKPMLRWRVRSYLLEILDLMWWTGRRRDAVRQLWASDIVREAGKIIAVRWRPTKHAEDAEEIAVSEEAAAALERQLARVKVIGDMPIFPSPRNAARPINEKALDEWLIKAEGIAKVDKQEGGLWHPYRRSWATKRKHLPDVDVARGGGWKRIEVMKTSYQQSDEETMRTVMQQPPRLVERKGGAS